MLGVAKKEFNFGATYIVSRFFGPCLCKNKFLATPLTSSKKYKIVKTNQQYFSN